jgi:hypothetical protein
MEAKIDAILLAVDPRQGDKLLKEIDGEYEAVTPVCGSYDC